MPLVVLKFGGTSVGSADSVALCCKAVGAALARPGDRAVVVVSALGGVTDLLIALTELARRRKRRAIEARLGELEERHRQALESVAPASGAWARDFAPQIRRLRLLLVATSLVGDMTERTFAAVCSYGEQLSARLMLEALAAQGIAAQFADATRLIYTDSNYREAEVDFTRSRAAFRRIVKPLLARRRVPVLGGFIGRNRPGHITLLGRGGSDYSASLAGLCLEADRVEIWTDVDGVMSADPRVVGAEVRTWPSLELAVVSEMAHSGAKVLHPKTITAAVNANIPVVVKNTFRPSAPGTRIVRGGRQPTLRGVVAQSNQSLFHFRESGMLSRPGFIHRCSEVFTRHGVPIDVCATSEITFSCSISSADYTEALRRDLEGVADVTVYQRLAKICVIGNQVTGDPSLVERIMRVLGGRKLYVLSVGASFTNVTFMTDEGDTAAVLRALHQALFNESRTS